MIMDRNVHKKGQGHLFLTLPLLSDRLIFLDLL